MQFKFPDVGEGIQEGVIVNWLKKEGDSVKLDEAICEIETDKAVVEIPSPTQGVIQKIFHKEGETIKVGEILAEFKPTSEKTTDNSATSTPNKKEQKEKSVVGSLEDADTSTSQALDLNSYTPSMQLEKKKIFESQSTDLPPIKELEKTNHKPEPNQQNTVNKQDNTHSIPLNKIKLVTAQRMISSLQSTAQVTQFADIVVDNIIQLRNQHKAECSSKDIKLTYLSFICKAYIQTLQEMPEFNARLNLENKSLELLDSINIAIAVNTENGLLVPVIKNANSLSVEEIAQNIQDLAQEARSNKLSPSQMQGQTVTVTNYGSLGSKYSTPILNSPDLINLGIGAFEKKLVLEDNQVKSQTIAPISLTFDHQAIDGAQAVEFLNKLNHNMQNLEY